MPSPDIDRPETGRPETDRPETGEQRMPGRLQFRARDGATLAGWELGPEGPPAEGTPIALLVHGTGLNGWSWLPVARRLTGLGWRAVALDLRGHGCSERSPDGDYSWNKFADDVVVVSESLAAGGTYTVMGVGHSAGATALLVADALDPGVLCCNWAFEPIMSVPGGNLREVRSPRLAEQARRRRATFASRQEALEHFRGRGAFAEFDEEALTCYVAGGVVPDGQGGFGLACPPEDEARVYEGAAAQNAWPLLARLHAPVRFVGGAASPAVPPGDLLAIATRARAGDPVVGGPVVMDGVGHFGPFARPDLVAEDISAFGVSTRCASGSR